MRTMTIRTCRRQGCENPPRGKGQQYCGEHAPPDARLAPSQMPPRLCARDGCPEPKATSAGRIYCSDACREMVAATRRQNLAEVDVLCGREGCRVLVARRSRYCSNECRYPALPHRACETCGDAYQPAGDNARYCSTSCRSGAAYLRTKRKRVPRQKVGRNQRNDHLWENFRWTLEQFEAKFEAQGRVCGLCGTDQPGGLQWVVDHDHACCPGRRACGLCNRAILCVQCNARLVPVAENTEMLDKAVAYVAHHRKLLAIRKRALPPLR